MHTAIAKTHRSWIATFMAPVLILGMIGFVLVCFGLIYVGGRLQPQPQLQRSGNLQAIKIWEHLIIDYNDRLALVPQCEARAKKYDSNVMERLKSTRQKLARLKVTAGTLSSDPDLEERFMNAQRELSYEMRHMRSFGRIYPEDKELALLVEQIETINFRINVGHHELRMFIKKVEVKKLTST
jgi:hypothetical protein